MWHLTRTEKVTVKEGRFCDGRWWAGLQIPGISLLLCKGRELYFRLVQTGGSNSKCHPPWKVLCHQPSEETTESSDPESHYTAPQKKRTTLLFLPHYHNFKQSAGVGYSGGSHFENLLAYKVRRKSLVFLLVIHSLSEHPLVAFSRLDHIKLCQILQKFQ